MIFQRYISNRIDNLMKFAVIGVFLGIFMLLLLPAVNYLRSDSIVIANKAEEALQQQIEELERKIEQTKSQANSLSREINIIENNISLKNIQIRQAEYQIEQKTKELELLEDDIGLMEVRLGRLDETIDYHSDLFAKRIRQQYIKTQQSRFELIVGSSNTGAGVGDFLARIEYLRRIEAQDRELIQTMNDTKGRYEDQQELLRQKKNQVEQIKVDIESQKVQAESLRSSLESQRNEKDHLLRVTQNDELRYQQLLEQAKQEYDALIAILAGSGIESSGEPVEEGQLVATVIQGRSCNSSGTHLHYTVNKNGKVANPFNYLKPISNYRNCSGAGACSSGDSFNPSGDWEWPLKGTITMTQGYGSTWATKNTWVRNIYSFHNGIDMYSNALGVYAAEDGIYYRGYYTGSGGCRLQYVRVDHEDSDISSYYLHVNY